MRTGPFVRILSQYAVVVCAYLIAAKAEPSILECENWQQSHPEWIQMLGREGSAKALRYRQRADAEDRRCSSTDS
jgi:hypothetical protein